MKYHEFYFEKQISLLLITNKIIEDIYTTILPSDLIGLLNAIRLKIEHYSFVNNSHTIIKALPRNYMKINTLLYIVAKSYDLSQLKNIFGI